MEDLKELKAILSEELEESFRRGNIVNKPRVPMLIVYADDESKSAKPEVDSILQHVWGNRKNDIAQIAMDGEGFRDVESGASLSEEDVQDSIDNMYAAENSFNDMNQICAVVLHCTTSYENLEDFKARFESIRVIKDLVSDIKATSIVFLDESSKCRGTAAEIKPYLAEMLEQDHRPYDSTVILSNRLSKGRLLTGRAMQENYAMSGWIMVLLNNYGLQFTSLLNLFYSLGNGCCLTAAFSEVNRPNDDICDIVLHSMLNWVDKQFASKGKVTATAISFAELCDYLGVSGGRAKFLEDFFQSRIADRLPTAMDLRFLPRAHMSAIDLAGQSFEMTDAETLGCTSAFIPELELFDEHTRDEFIDFITKFVRERLTAGTIANAFTVSNVQELIRSLRPSEPNTKDRTDSYIYEKVHSDYVNWALPICEEVFGSEQKKSVTNTREFENIIQEFSDGYFPNPDLEKYYTEITIDALESTSTGLGDRLLSNISSNGNQRSEILEYLKKAAQEVFSSDAVFKMPLEQEMVKRMGQNPDDIHNQIYNTLFKDLDAKIRLKSPLALTELKQITIVNRNDTDGNETELYRSIKHNVTDAANMDYFDSCNNNTIKIIRFYECQKSNLM